MSVSAAAECGIPSTAAIAAAQTVRRTPVPSI